MSGLLVRRDLPLALMKSACRVPISLTLTALHLAELPLTQPRHPVLALGPFQMRGVLHAQQVARILRVDNQRRFRL